MDTGLGSGSAVGSSSVSGAAIGCGFGLCTAVCSAAWPLMLPWAPTLAYGGDVVGAF